MLDYTMLYYTILYYTILYYTGVFFCWFVCSYNPYHHSAHDTSYLDSTQSHIQYDNIDSTNCPVLVATFCVTLTEDADTLIFYCLHVFEKAQLKSCILIKWWSSHCFVEVRPTCVLRIGLLILFLP